MAEPFSDEILLAYVDKQGDAACGHYEDLGRMIRRLQTERDEARTVAFKLALWIRDAAETLGFHVSERAEPYVAKGYGYLHDMAPERRESTRLQEVEHG